MPKPNSFKVPHDPASIDPLTHTTCNPAFLLGMKVSRFKKSPGPSMPEARFSDHWLSPILLALPIRVGPFDSIQVDAD